MGLGGAVAAGLGPPVDAGLGDVERFASKLEIYSETCNTDAQYRIFKIAAETIWEFLDDIKAIER